MSAVTESLKALANSTQNEQLKEYITSLLDSTVHRDQHDNHSSSATLPNHIPSQLFLYLYQIIKMWKYSESEDDVKHILKMVTYAIPSGESINSLISSLVTNFKKYSFSLNSNTLQIVEDCLRKDNPQYIRFPGDKDSFLQVQTSTVGMQGVRAFSVAIWAKLDMDCSQKGFLLFRCSGQKGGIDAILSDRQSDGLWSITLRVFADRDNSTVKVDIKGRVYFTLGGWHHFVMKHEENNRIAFLVDGILEMENELPYQFASAAQYKWTFGIGLKGGIANICFYSESLGQSAIQVLHSLGPHTKSIATGVVSIPQSSFDTGHAILGTRISKGTFAHKLCRLAVMFNISAAHLLENANLPQFPLGRLNPDHTEMTARPTNTHGSSSSFLSPTVTGGCKIESCHNWVNAWLDAGGCNVLLYLIGFYCKALNSNSDSSLLATSDATNTNTTVNIDTSSSSSSSSSLLSHSYSTELSTLTDSNISILKCIKAAISLLTQFIRISASAREQFIQIHGFHILSQCLSRIQREKKELYIDQEFVNLCCDLLPAFGFADSRGGDGVAAAFQGLLFDFRVWGDMKLEMKMRHMLRLLDITSSKGEELERCIGVQRILDILRLYILRQETRESAVRADITSSINSNSSSGSSTYSNSTVTEFESLQIQCAEAGYSLLSISTDAALVLYQRTNTRSFITNDIEVLLSCLEETSSCLLAERILRILLKFRENVPSILSEILWKSRFSETTMVALISRKGFSAEVYREAFALILWGLVRECQLDTHALLQLRKTLVLPVGYIPTATAGSGAVLADDKKRMKSVRLVSPTDLKRLAEGAEIIKTAMRPALKAWNSVSMLSVLIARALAEGFWNQPYLYSNTMFSEICASSATATTAISSTFNNTTTAPSTSSSTSTTGTGATAAAEEYPHRMKVINEILSVFHNVTGPFGGRSDFWIVLPLLPPLLNHCDLAIYQQVLMSFVVSLKTDEGQVETICNLPDRGWTTILIDLAAIGERYCCSSGMSGTSLKSAVEGSGETAEAGEEVQMSEREGLAITCTELSLDAAATMLEHKVRYHDQDSWSCWNCLQNCIKSSCSAFGDKASFIEKQLIKRCLAMVFQRLARMSDAWNAGMVSFVENILTLIANKGLCGQDSSSSSSSSSSPAIHAFLLSSTHTDALNHSRSNSVRFADINNRDSIVLVKASADEGESSESPVVGVTTTTSAHSQRELTSVDVTNDPSSSGSSSSQKKRITQSVEEQQLLLFLIDVMGAWRRATTKQNTYGRELVSLRLSLSIILSCMPISTEISAEKICNEVMNNIVYVSKTPSLSLSVEEYKQYIIVLFAKLEMVIKDASLDSNIRGRYHGLIYRICYHLGDMRQSRRSSISSGDDVVAPYVWPTIDSLNGIENCPDTETIFELFKVSLMCNDTISFDEMEEVSPPILPINEVKDNNDNDDELLDLNISVLSATTAAPVSAVSVDKTMDQDVNPDLLASSSLPAVELNEPSEQQAIDSQSIALTMPGNENPLECVSSAEREVTTTAAASVEMLGPVATTLATEIVVDTAVNTELDTSAVIVVSSSVNPSTAGSLVSNSDLSSVVKDPQFVHWMKTRQGIIVDRIDSERLRLSQSMQSLDLSTAAIDKHWTKIQRKVETESFLLSHSCQWKLGVAHEGAFPGRRRIVIRPRFDISGSTVASRAGKNANGDELHLETISAFDDGNNEDLKQALAKACAGYIFDVARMTNETNPTAEANTFVDSKHGNTTMSPQQPGEGWGLIGADGSDEGFGVIGLTHGGVSGNDDLNPFELNISQVASPSPDKGKLMTSGTATAAGEEVSVLSTLEATSGGTKTAALSASAVSAVPVVDMNGDIKLVEEAMQQGRRIDTGPCHTGTRRMSNGPPSMSARVTLVTASGNFFGILSLAPKDVYFLSLFDRSSEESQDDSAAVNVARQLRIRRRRWTISSISAVYLRRYRLRETAIEVFFRRGKHRHFFVDFGPTKEDAKTRINFARALMEASPISAFKQWPLMSPFRLVSEHKIQDKWIRGEISNFDYLMALNTISGRSFNDLCQYPVMPWVIADYTSSTIDLSDPAIYRDLSKPMGALNEARLQDFLERYTSFAENETIRDIPPFMYGSHYSTMVGVVLHFLIRLQPFASLHKEMQNGRFDVADRLFSSIPMTFLHNTTQLSEVKELTPEWFTTPEMFRNVNNFDFGLTQDGSEVNDVELPLWANSAEEFVLINRQALESEYVSAHLHEWIDLIFGYKQIGPAAVEAHNVFYYLTYAGSVDRQMIKDEELRKAIELQIAHFGQVPQQLFRSPHPARQVIPKTQSPRPLTKCFAYIPSITENQTSTRTLLSFVTTKPPNVPQHFEVGFVPFATDEEELSALSKCAMVTRRNPALTRKLTLTSSSPTSYPDGSSFSTSSLRPIRQSSSGGSVSTLACGNILTFCICTERVVVVVDTGVIEVYKYCTADGAKSALVKAANAKSRARRRQMYDTADKNMAVAMALAADADIISFDENNASTLPRPPNVEDISSGGGNEPGNRSSMSLSTGRGQGLEYQLAEFDEPIIAVEKDNTHFEVLPRISLAQTQIFPLPSDQTSASSSSSYPSADHSYSMLPLSSSDAVERSAQLVNFSSSGHLLFSAGHVDGSVYVREIDSRTGFIVSAGDFLGHRHQVVSISSDFISGASTDVIASCDAFGQILVWTVSLSQAQVPAAGVGRMYIISRRPQRMFRSISCPHSCLDISWQMGIVAVAAAASIRLFSIEREEMLRCIDLSSLCLSEYIAGSASANASASSNETAGEAASASSSSGISTTAAPESLINQVEVLNELSSTLCYSRSKRHAAKYVREKPLRGKSFAAATSIDTSTLEIEGAAAAAAAAVAATVTKATAVTSSESALLDETIGSQQQQLKPGKEKEATVIIRRIHLCNDGIIVLHVQVGTASSSSSAAAKSPPSSYKVTTEQSSEEAQQQSSTPSDSHSPASSSPPPASTMDSANYSSSSRLRGASTASSTTSGPTAPPPPATVHLLLSLSLSGYQTGRVVLTAPVTYLNCVSRGDVTVAGFEDGKVALFSSHDLKLMYEFYPHEDAQCVSATYATALNSVLCPSAIICVKVGPNELHPAVICASTVMGELYFRPLPDFIRWEKTRLPSALSQIVNAPLQAVRGTLQQATSLGAWTTEQAGALATNAKSFADETITELTKLNKGKFLQSIGNFFGVSKSEKEKDES